VVYRASLRGGSRERRILVRGINGEIKIGGGGVGGVEFDDAGGAGDAYLRFASGLLEEAR